MSRDLHVRIDDRQYAFLKWARAQTGLTMADLVREALNATYDADLPAFDVAERDTSAEDTSAGETSVANGFNGDTTGNAEDVNAKQYAQAGLVGIRGKGAGRAAGRGGGGTGSDGDTPKKQL